VDEEILLTLLMLDALRNKRAELLQQSVRHTNGKEEKKRLVVAKCQKHVAGPNARSHSDSRHSDVSATPSTIPPPPLPTTRVALATESRQAGTKYVLGASQPANSTQPTHTFRADQLLRDLRNMADPFPTETQEIVSFSPQVAKSLPRLLPVRSVRLVSGPKKWNQPNGLETIAQLVAHTTSKPFVCNVQTVSETDPRTGLRRQKKLVAGQDGKRHQMVGVYAAQLNFEYEVGRFGPLRRVDFDRYAVSPQTLVQGKRVVYSAIGACGNEMRFINSCSDKLEPTAQELATKNVCFVEALINDAIPVMLVMLDRAVKTGEELLLDYGRDYWEIIQWRETEQQQLVDLVRRAHQPIEIT
jgi:hypothetical protein